MVAISVRLGIGEEAAEPGMDVPECNQGVGP